MGSPPSPQHRHHSLVFAEALAGLEGLLIHAGDVFEDLVALEAAFPDPRRHAQALQAILGQLALLRRRTLGVALKGGFAGWRRHAFESARQSRAPADLRAVYRPLPDGRIELLGFGPRHVARDVYPRLRARAGAPRARPAGGSAGAAGP